MRELLDLESARTWRLALGVLFIVALVLRAGLVLELGDHWCLRQHEARGTHSAHLALLANRIVAGDVALRGVVPPLTQTMLASMPPQAWIALNEGRLPRGAGMLWPLALSLHMTAGESVGPYIVLSLLAGALTAVLVALLGELLFQRAVGLLAGLLVALGGSLATASARVGPWGWEAFLSAAVVLAAARALRHPREPGEWALLGICCGIAIWFRGIFWWAPLLVAGACAARRVLTLGAAASLAVPLLVGGGGLVLRNIHVGAPPLPLVGAAAFELARNWNPAAIPTPALAGRPHALVSSEGQPWRLAAALLGDRDVRASAPTLLRWRLRQVIGARDEPADLSNDYVRRRSMWLRTFSFSSDTIMALGWAGVLLLATRRQLGGVLGAAIGIGVLHGVAFTPWGDDRTPLLTLLPIPAASALVSAWQARHRQPTAPWLFLTVWASVHLLLQMDDRERDPRFRWEDFRNANIFLAQGGRLEEAYREIDDWDARELFERDHDPHQRLSIRFIRPR